MNEEFQVTVNNTTREITEIDKEFELVEVIPTYTETVHNVEKKSTIINEETKVTKENVVKRLPVTGY